MSVGQLRGDRHTIIDVDFFCMQRSQLRERADVTSLERGSKYGEKRRRWSVRD